LTSTRTLNAVTRTVTAPAKTVTVLSMFRAAVVTVLIVVFGLYGCENGTWDERGTAGESEDTTGETSEQSTEESTGESTEEPTASVPGSVEAGLTPAEAASSSARAAAESSQTTCHVLLLEGGPSLGIRVVDIEAVSRGCVHGR
jgi:hypothetical protein